LHRIRQIYEKVLRQKKRKIPDKVSFSPKKYKTEFTVVEKSSEKKQKILVEQKTCGDTEIKDPLKVLILNKSTQARGVGSTT